jgi:HK97 family phage prohead protease
MAKSFNTYQLKSQNLSVKDIDETSRKVSFYLSAFDLMDSDNDIIRKGAFTKSINERGPVSNSNRKIAFLRYHNWEMPIGKFLELSEDSKGLYAVAELGSSTLGEDALHDYKDGIIREHSIGFQYVKDKISFIEDKNIEAGGYFDIAEVKLWEGSAVTFGANEHTNVVEVGKSLTKDEILLKSQNIATEIDILGKAISQGKGTDERLHSLEMKLKFLTSQLVSLVNVEPFNKHSVKEDKPKEQFNWSEVLIKTNDFLEVKQTYADYPQSAVNNAKKGIKLNEEQGNKCATNVGKQRARDIASKRGLSLDVIKRVYSYLSRAEEYYNPDDETACGTISYLLWGGKSMKSWAEKKINQLEN